MKVQGKETYLVGMPYHWGNKGVVKGDSANDLLGLALDPNVHIGEYKVATCDIRPGRRPRGPALTTFVEGYRSRVRSERVQEFAERPDENGGGGS